MSRESSVEEDGQHFIDHNEIAPSISSPKRSTFGIGDDFNDRIRRRRLRFSPLNKWYLFAIFLPFFIIVVYFATDFRDFFRTSVSYVNLSPPPHYDHMRESDLQALYLLRQQQLGFFNLWNQTVAPESNFTSNFSSNSAFLEDLKSTLLSQISLNNQIKHVLLSSHATVVDDLTIEKCGKQLDHQKRLSERKTTLEWKPRANKYLIAICVSGQMSNHLVCLEKHMLFAALLGRMLVIPSAKIDYEFARVIDIDHINSCIGREVVVPFDVFAKARKKKHVHIDKFLCYFSSPHPCLMDDDRVKKLKGIGITMDKLKSPWDEDINKPTEKTMKDVLRKFSSDEDNVIAIGDVLFANVEQGMMMQAGGPLAHKCKTLMEPSRIITITAQRFIQTFLGKRFIALHFRRSGGFLKSCNEKRESCFFPVPQAADCINRIVEKVKVDAAAAAPVIYLSTDAGESETRLLQSLVFNNGKKVPLVKRPQRNKAEKWDSLLYRHGLEEDPQVEAMLDKTISAMATVFIGSSGSSFSDDIMRLRKDWGLTSLCDQYLCQGQSPNFIADNE